MRLVGERIVVRSIELSDAENIVKYSRDTTVLQFTHIPNDYPVEDCKTWIKQTHQNLEEGTDYQFILIDRETKEFLGGVGIIEISKRDNRAEIGYWLKKDARGKGYITEAVNLILKFAFEDLELHKIVINCDVDNKASKKVIERAGGIKEGTLRKHSFNGENYVDVYSYSILKEEWSKK